MLTNEWELLKEYLAEKIDTCEDECTEHDLSQVLFEMEKLEKNNKK